MPQRLADRSEVALSGTAGGAVTVENTVPGHADPLLGSAAVAAVEDDELDAAAGRIHPGHVGDGTHRALGLPGAVGPADRSERRGRLRYPLRRRGFFLGAGAGYRQLISDGDPLTVGAF